MVLNEIGAMNVSGFWIGEYTYAENSSVVVSFKAELNQLAAILEGQTTEQNTFDDLAGQILVANLFGRVSGQSIIFTKTYCNSLTHKDKISYAGTISEDGNTILGTWTILDIWKGSFRMTKAIEQKPSPKAVSIKDAETV